MKNTLNIPNTLSLIRVLLVPAFVLSLLLMRDIEIWGLVVPAIIFLITAITDVLDGKIARKHNLITDFGKFIDPLADKFLVIGSQIAILAHLFLRGEITEGLVFVWVVLIILLRELAVTSIRLVVAGKSGIVVAASIFGKIKTVSQIVAISTVFLEPVVQRVARLIAEAVTGKNLCWRTDIVPLTWLSLLFAAVMTVWSGINYIKAYWKYLDPQK